MSPGDPVRLKFFIICQIVELAKSERGELSRIEFNEGQITWDYTGEQKFWEME